MSLLGSSQPLHFFLINDIERTINSFHSVLFFCFISIKKRKKKKDREWIHERTLAFDC